MNPYEPPRAESAAKPVSISRGPGRHAQLAVLAVVVLRVVSAIARLAANAEIVPERVAKLSQQLTSVVYLVALVLVLTWLSGTIKRLVAAGRTDFPYTPTVAVVWWFVPIANLFQIPRI